MIQKQPVIGIIGGRGKTGSWFARFFKANGYQVLIADQHTKLTSEKLIARSDVVIFSLPIDITPEVIREFAPLAKPEQLWMDFTSIKTPAVNAMLRSQAEVIGCHPMFGPMVDSIVEQTVIVCPVRVKRWKGWWERLLKANKATVKISTPAEHDRMMAIVQGLTHFSAITIAHTLRELGVDIPASLSFTSPVYKIHLDMEGRILAQDPGLYAAIQVLNPETREVLHTHLQSVSKLFQTVEQRDLAAFIDYFQKAAEYLGDFKEQALAESNDLIKALVERQDKTT